MMNKENRLRTPALLLSFLFVLLYIVNTHIVHAENTPYTEEKLYCEATLEDDFLDNNILVVMKNEISLQFKTYAPNDFPEISCENVVDLTQEIGASVKAKLNEISRIIKETDFENYDYLNELPEINIDTYHQILSIRLEEKGKKNVLEAIRLLEKRDDVLCADPNYAIQTYSAPPDDTYYSLQWAVEKIQLPEAWDITTGSSSIIVGIVDTGIDASHPELAGKINTSLCRDFTSGSAVIVTSPTDSDGHGTHVAGIIAATADNDEGIAGVCWNVQLASLKVKNSELGYSDRIVLAIQFATTNEIPILNISLGTQSNSNALRSAVENYPGLLVCAAGNDNKNNDTNATYPANYRLENVISVGASDRNDQRWMDDANSGSHYGENTVDLFAPGYEILSLDLDGGYIAPIGTSVAAPFVTGVAALLLSVHPELTASEVKQIIMGTVDIVYDSNGNDVFGDLCVSGGRLNAYKALTSALLHSLQYTNLGISAGHTATCTECGCSYTEAHDWVIYPTHAICNTCGVVSENVTRPQIAPLPEIKEEIE